MPTKTTYADRILAVLSGRFSKVETIAKKTEITPAQVRRALTKLANDGKAAVRCGDDDKPTSAKMIAEAPKQKTTKTKSKSRKLKPAKVEQVTEATVIGKLDDAVQSDPTGVKIGNFVKLLMDNHQFRRPFSTSVRRLFGKRKWLYSHDGFTGDHITQAYELLVEHAAELVPLVRADVSPSDGKTFQVVYEEEGQQHATEVEAVGIGAAIAAVRRGKKSFSLIDCTAV